MFFVFLFVLHVHASISNLLCAFVSGGGIWCRRHTWTSYWVKDVSQRHSTEVSPGMNARCIAYEQYSLFVVPFSVVSVISFHSFLTAQGGLQFSPRGLRPSCSLMTARHLDQNTMGYLQWRWGPNSAMTTSLVRDTKSSHFTLALQVHTKSTFIIIFKLTEATYNIYSDVLNHFSSTSPSPSWGCLTSTWWWVTITSSRMMTRQKLKALLSRFSSYPVFNKLSTVWIVTPERILYIIIKPQRLLCFLAVSGQAGLVLSWNMEQNGRSADTVSCQPLSALVSLRESPSKSSTIHWSTYNSDSNILQQSPVYGCSCLTSGWHVPVKTICFQSTWQTSFYPVLSSMPLSDPYSPTWPSTDWSSSHIQKPRKKSQPPFCFIPFYYDAQRILFHHSSRKLKYDNFIENPLRTWALSLCVYLLPRELELQRKSSATDIAKKKQEAESAVSTGTCKQAVVCCVCGIIGHCLWVPLSSLCWKNFIYFFSFSSTPPPSYSYSFSLGSSAGSADAGICEENHRSGRI